MMYGYFVNDSSPTEKKRGIGVGRKSHRGGIGTNNSGDLSKVSGCGKICSTWYRCGSGIWHIQRRCVSRPLVIRGTACDSSNDFDKGPVSSTLAISQMVREIIIPL
jgi:hypothetical protein